MSITILTWFPVPSNSSVDVFIGAGALALGSFLALGSSSSSAGERTLNKYLLGSHSGNPSE